MSKRRRKSRRRSSRSKNQIRSSGNGPFAKLSKKVFRKTGMPLSRLIFVVFGLILIGGLIFYAFRDQETSTVQTQDLTTPTNLSGKSDAERFLNAVSVPADFTSRKLPVRLDILQEMISKCKSLLNEDTKYTSRVQEKLISLTALQAVTLSQAKIDPQPTLKELARMTALFSNENSDSESTMTLAYAHLTALSFAYNQENYDAASKAVDKLNDTTLASTLKLSGCVNQAVRLLLKNPDDEQVIDLVNRFGQKLADNKDVETADAGLALLDYPNFSQFYQQSIGTDSSRLNTAKTLEMLKQAVATPPQSPYTADELLKIPERLLQDGRVEAAKKTLAQITAILLSSSQRIRTHVETSKERLATRVGLFDKPFHVDGSNSAGESLKSDPNKKSIILFFDPNRKNSRQAIVSLDNSPIHDPWETDIFIVPVTKLEESQAATWQKKFPHLMLVDLATAKDWTKRTGISSIPYQIILDKDDSVIRVGSP